MFLIEKKVEDVWRVSQRHPEKWRAREIVVELATISNPARVVDSNTRKVICYHGGNKSADNVLIIQGTEVIGVLFPRGGSAALLMEKLSQGWNRYGYDTVKKDSKTELPSHGEETKMETKEEIKSSVVETGPAVVPTIQTPPGVPVQVGATPPGVEEMLSDTDDVVEGDHSPEKKTIPAWTGNPKVALLFSGGIFSTAMLLNLIKKGYLVTPFYVSDSNFEGTERENKIARGTIRIAKSIAPDQVEDLEIIETKISKQMIVRRRRKYIELLTTELVGKGFNAIAYGCPLLFDEEKDEDENADTDAMFLQELTPLQVVSPETLDKSTLEDMLEGISDPEMRSMIYMSTSCTDPGSRECGDCPTCIRRFRLLMRMWGEPNKTKYMKGSKVRGMKRAITALFDIAQKTGTIPDSGAIEAILKPKKAPVKVEEED